MNLKKLMLVSLLVLSNSVYAQDRFGRDPWGEERREDARDVEMYVGQYFQGQSSLDLIRDHYIRSQLQGKRIKQVIVTASTEAGQGIARVLFNGTYSDGPQTVARQMAKYTFRADSFAHTIGQGLRTLELEMRGRFYVEKVLFDLAKDNGPVGPGPGTPQVEVVRQQLNETIQGEGGLHLFRMFNLGLERQGQIVRRVALLARSQRGHGSAELHVNEQSQGLAQTVRATTSRLTFDLLPGQKIGQEIKGLRLFFKGNITIEEVSIEIEKRNVGGNGPGPSPLERRLEQVINQRLYDTSGVNLTALMRIERRHEERIVESVELVLRNSDYGTRLKLCQVIQGQYQSMNCGNIATLNPGAQIVRLTSVNFAKLSEVSLSVRMGMIDIERIIINLR